MTATITPIGPMAVFRNFDNFEALRSSTPSDVLAALAVALNDPNMKGSKRIFIAHMRHTYGMTCTVPVRVRTAGKLTIFGVDHPDATMPTDFIKPNKTVGGEVLMPDEVYVFEINGRDIFNMSWTYGDADKAMAEMFGDTDNGC